jgi:DNA-binding transcriptional LysR family regulator
VGYALAPESLAAASGPGVSFTRLPDNFPPLRLAAVWLGGADNPALRRFISQLRLAAQATPVHSFAAE